MKKEKPVNFNYHPSIAVKAMDEFIGGMKEQNAPEYDIKIMEDVRTLVGLGFKCLVPKDSSIKPIKPNKES